MRNIKIVVVVIIVILTSSMVFADDLKQERPHALTKMFDLILIRPISIVVSMASTGLYIASVPFTFPAGVSEPAARILVEAPWRFTGGRYLGEFNHYKDGKPITVICEK